MNYRYLRNLCNEQKRQIERWKKYCEREEDLLCEVLELVDYYEIGELDYVAHKIEKLLEVNNVR